jgi:hypothetical protein
MVTKDLKPPLLIVEKIACQTQEQKQQFILSLAIV